MDNSENVRNHCTCSFPRNGTLLSTQLDFEASQDNLWPLSIGICILAHVVGSVQVNGIRKEQGQSVFVLQLDKEWVGAMSFMG
jgi:hypothetical protein